MTPVRYIFLVGVLSSFYFYNCADESNPVNTNREPLDPITNQWRSETDEDYRFTFTTFDSTSTRGIFTGDEDNPDQGFNSLIGFFYDYYVEFDVLRNGENNKGLKFKGNFINSNRMEIESEEGKLVLIR